MNLKKFPVAFLVSLFLVYCPSPKSKSPLSNPAAIAVLAAGASRSSSSSGTTSSDLSTYGRVLTLGKTYSEISGTSVSSGTIKLGMEFNFGGSKFSEVTASSGGYGFFYKDSYAIFPWYGTSGQVSYQASGTKFTIQFKGVKDTSSTSYASYNYQVILDSKDSSVEILYGPKSKTSSSYKPYAAYSVGMSSSKGSVNIIYGGNFSGTLNHGDFPASGTSIKYTPASTSDTVTDPLAMFQWHLYNYGQLGGTSGEDANVSSVHSAGNKGDGIKVVVVDDGQDINHEDLKDNVLSGAGKNYLYSSADPSGSTADHGTCVSGVIGARDGNIYGGKGAAPRASIFGYNLLQSLTSTNEQNAMTGNGNINAFDISNNSWGAPDDRGTYATPNSTWKTAIDTGVTNGRSGKGAVYFWAAGNGGFTVDDSNYDGQANYYGVIAVGAIGDDGKKASYSEEGANIWVAAHSQGTSGTAITTTDNTYASYAGYNSLSSSIKSDFYSDKYTNTFNGTSSAAPLAAGVGALILKANPNLTWRDVRLIIAETARKNDASDSGWLTAGTKITGGSYNFSHKYGFGAIDAKAAVALASSWTNVGTQVVYTSGAGSGTGAIPDNNATGLTGTVNISGSGITSVEFVEVNVGITHTYVGDLAVTLTSPAGTVSTLSKTHGCKTSSFTELGSCSFTGNVWRYGSARHLGEAANGTWTLKVADGASGDTGTLSSWSLKFYGR